MERARMRVLLAVAMANRFMPAAVVAVGALVSISIYFVGKKKETQKSDQEWRSLIPLLVKEDWVRGGRLTSTFDDERYKSLLLGNPWAKDFDSWCLKANHKASIQKCVDIGWAQEEAGVLGVCSDYNPLLTSFVRDGCSDYSPLLRKFYELIVSRAVKQATAPVTFKYLRGSLKLGKKSKGLADREIGWLDVVDGKAYTAEGNTHVYLGQCATISPEGVRLSDWKTKKMIAIDSPVVQFISRPHTQATNDQLHTAVFIDATNLVFPPMTCFEKVREAGPGWIFDGTEALLMACKKLTVALNSSSLPTLAPIVGEDGRIRMAVARAALEAWLEEHHRIESDVFDRTNPEHQKWLDSNLLPANATSTVYHVQRKLIVVQATYRRSRSLSA